MAERIMGLLPSLAVAAVVGLGLGFFVGTRVLFPAPEAVSGLVEVPDLTGLTAGAVPSRLEGMDLVLGAVDSVRHPEVPEGQVLAQSPLPGQRLLPGDTVSVILSAGPEERPVPDLIRIHGDRARVVLESSGFTVLTDSAESDFPRGIVLELDPEPGTMVALPAEVTVLLSTGPPLVEVPLLVGLSQEEAEAALDSLGLVLAGVEERFRFGLDQGTVIEQRPAAREMVVRGGEVWLVVGRRGSDPGRVQDLPQQQTIQRETPAPRPESSA